MAPHVSSLMTLRVITQRLAVTPAWQLPNIVVQLASSLTTCKPALTTSDLRYQRKDGSDVALLIHKFKAQLSALLQDKSPEARWGGIVLIKAAIETGNWEILCGSGAWVRGLLGILSKTDPPATKELCIITLTRIFLLIEGHQSLVRDITTPSLPGFITLCLNLVKPRISPGVGNKISCQDSILNTILQSFSKLLPQHPTLFRPFVNQMRSLVLPTIAATPSHLIIDEDSQQRPLAGETCVAQSSRKLFVLLSSCAPKNDSASDWAQSLQSIIRSIHRTSDRAFRAIIEDWEPLSSRPQLGAKLPHDFAKIVCGLDNDDSGLPVWRGIHAGIERLDGLLHILLIFLTTPTKLSVGTPLGALIDATERILSIIPPFRENDAEYGGPTVNPEAGKEEREGLWWGLPRIHVSALKLLVVVILRFGRSIAVVSHVILERALWVFEAERSNSHVRTETYRLVAEILKRLGLSLSKKVASLLSTCIKFCCEDLLPSNNGTTPTEYSSTYIQKQAKNSVSTNADSYLSLPTKAVRLSEEFQETEIAAISLLSVAIKHVPKDFLTYSLRAQIDRTAIMIKNKSTMLASVLDPPARRKGAREPSSIMPLLAREFPCSLEVEALVRPRMPILKLRTDDIEDLCGRVGAEEGINEQPANRYDPRQDFSGMELQDEQTPHEMPHEETESHEQVSTNGTKAEKMIEPHSLISSQFARENANPITSPKRYREPSPSTKSLPQPIDLEVPGDAPSSEQNRSPKRARLEVGYSDIQGQPKSPGTEPGLIQRQQSSIADEPLVILPNVTKPTYSMANISADMSSSDGSDSEIPEIDPEPDTDMDMEDEEDE